MRREVVLNFLTPAPFILALYAKSGQERADVSMAPSLQTLVRITAFIVNVTARE